MKISSSHYNYLSGHIIIILVKQGYIIIIVLSGHIIILVKQGHIIIVFILITFKKLKDNEAVNLYFDFILLHFHAKENISKNSYSIDCGI